MRYTRLLPHIAIRDSQLIRRLALRDSHIYIAGTPQIGSSFDFFSFRVITFLHSFQRSINTHSSSHRSISTLIIIIASTRNYKPTEKATPKTISSLARVSKTKATLKSKSKINARPAKTATHLLRRHNDIIIKITSPKQSPTIKSSPQAFNHNDEIYYLRKTLTKAKTRSDRNISRQSS